MTVPWTEAEKRTLRRYWDEGGAKACVGMLPGRSLQAIRGQACRLGLSRRRVTKRIWTGYEDRAVLAVAVRMPLVREDKRDVCLARLAAQLGVTPREVRERMRKIGVGA
jgi:hypothetical protein